MSETQVSRNNFRKKTKELTSIMMPTFRGFGGGLIKQYGSNLKDWLVTLKRKQLNVNKSGLGESMHENR